MASIKYNLFKRKSKSSKGYDWYYTYTDPHTGVRKQKRCKDCATLKEARAFIESLPKAVFKSVSFGNFAEGFYDDGGRWITEREKRGYAVKKATLYKKENMLRNIILPQWQYKDIAKITTKEIIEWTDALQYSNEGKNHILAAMKDIFKAAFSDGLIPFNPLSEAPHYKPNPKEKETLTDEEIGKCFPRSLEKLEELYGGEVGICALVMLTSGIRMGEAVALQWGCFDSELNGIKIIRQWGVLDGFGAPKKKEYRSIILPAEVGALLSELKKQKNGQPDDFVFTVDGRHLEARDFAGMIKTIKKLTGKHITAHCLRHTYNTKMRNIFLREGIGEDVLRALTGHKSINMTDHYDHPLLDAKMRALAEYRPAVDGFFNE